LIKLSVLYLGLKLFDCDGNLLSAELRQIIVFDDLVAKVFALYWKTAEKTFRNSI
jgi:hypothetical protein